MQCEPLIIHLCRTCFYIISIRVSFQKKSQLSRHFAELFQKSSFSRPSTFYPLFVRFRILYCFINFLQVTEVSTLLAQNMTIQPTVLLKMNNTVPNMVVMEHPTTNTAAEVPSDDVHWVPWEFNQPTAVQNHHLHHRAITIHHLTIQKTATKYQKPNATETNSLPVEIMVVSWWILCHSEGKAWQRSMS